MTTGTEIQNKLEKAYKDNVLFMRVGGRKARGACLRNIGALISGYLHIIDPYMFSPEDIDEMLEYTEGNLHTVKILTTARKTFEDIIDERGAYHNLCDSFKRKCNEHGIGTFGLKFMEDYKDENQKDVTRLFHDRFIITENRCWMIGGSIKDMGIVNNNTGHTKRISKVSYILDFDYFLKNDTDVIKNIVTIASPLNKSSDVIKRHFTDYWNSTPSRNYPLEFGYDRY